jgi:hypothetical protein
VEHVSIFRVEEYAKQETSEKQVSTCYLLHAGLLLGLVFDLEDGRHMFLRNTG